MRIIAGSRKGLTLAAPKGTATRPTTDRIKETLFNIIAPRIQGCSFLDLFAGSGGIGLEALSRGAAHCTFVDKESASIACIRSNIEKAGFGGISDVVRRDFASCLGKGCPGAPFDIVFIDPPYGSGLEKTALELLLANKAVASGSLVIIECAAGLDTGFVGEAGFDVLRVKEYGSNKHIFTEIKGENNDNSSVSGQL